MRVQESKIKLIREALGISQMDFASIIYSDTSKVSKAENGLAQYAGTQVRFIKKHFGMEDLPLTQHECVVYKKRMYRFHDNIRDGWLEEAEKQYRDMAGILVLDACDEDLPMLFRLFEVALFVYGRKKLREAEEMLDFLQARLDKMTDEHKYHYYFYRGVVHTRRGRYDEGLECHKKALELSHDLSILTQDDLKRVHLGIVACYTFQDYPSRAIVYAQSANTPALYTNRKVNTYDLHFDIEVALNYIRLNEIARAEELLDNCLIHAQSLDNDLYIGMTLHNYGRLHRQTEDWDKAIDCFKQAMEHSVMGAKPYLMAVHEMVFCLVGKRTYSNARRLLEDNERLFLNDETYHIAYKALVDYITISSRISLFNQPTDYIEEVAIPHFEKTCDYFMAMDYYKLLEKYFAEKNKKKSLLMSEAIRRIYERCFMNIEGR
ncbi:MAG: tetratricopeptide repeat protein [Defluviitaleaceae bacterium]|nr:tetratricopeptide repeat protein [Defluviitaleaceae bacterium]